MPKKFIAIIIAIIVISLAVGFAVAWNIAKEKAPNGIACTQEAKLCADGSAVGRTGPNCEFAPCPEDVEPEPAFQCLKDSDCPSTTLGTGPSTNYMCQEIQGSGTACPDNDPSCVPTYTIIQGECKLKEGSRCNLDSDCASGNLCSGNICKSPVGRECLGPNDNSCPSDYECVQGCGSPVGYENEPPPPYFCQLKGYVRTCPICLAKGTFIDTLLGRRAIENLEKGLAVWTVNKSGERVIGVVVKTSKTPVPADHKMVQLVLKDGRILLVSPRHPTTQGRTVGDLTSGDIYDGARVITTNRVSYDKGFTYDILVSGETGFYFANGIVLESTLK